MSILSNFVSEGIGAVNTSGFQIAEKELAGREDLIQPMLVRDGDTLSLELICELLEDEIRYQGIPTVVEYGTLRTGGLFNHDTERIIVLNNIDHPRDYLRHLIRFRMTGNRLAEIKVYSFGFSRMYEKREKMGSCPSLLDRVTGALRQVEMKAQEEESYYSALAMCIQDVYDRIIIPD